MRKIVAFKFIAYVSTAFLIYIIALTIFTTTAEMLNLPSFLVILFVALACVLILGMYLLATRTICINNLVFLIFLCILTTLPRLLWVLFIDTKPISDFGLYHSYAVNASNGVYNLYHFTYPLFPFKFGYPLVLSVIYRIFGASVHVGMLFNVAVALGISLTLLWIGSMIFNKRAGQASSLLFACWPAQIMYSSVLAAEHLFILLLLVVIGLFCALKNKLLTGNGYAILCAVVGIVAAAANFLRPIAVLIFPVLLFYLLAFVDVKGSVIQGLLKKAAAFSIILLAFIISFASITIPLSKKIGVPLWRSSSGFSFLVGTNFESDGAYNIQDEDIIKEFNYDFDKVHKTATQRAVNRIKSAPVEFARVVEKKYITVWSNEDYGYSWSIAGSNSRGSVYLYVLNNPDKFRYTSQIYYIVILVFAAIGIVSAYKNLIYENIILLLIFLSVFIMHTFLEAQSRYHYYVVPLLILIAGYGLWGKLCTKIELTQPF
jgi:hypothetical protein